VSYHSAMERLSLPGGQPGWMRSGRADLGAAALVGGAAVIVLLVLSLVYPAREFYVTNNALMSTDQVGYITSARWLADTGELHSHMIYPGHLDDPRWRLYMPGIYWVLAAGHLLLGPGPVAWRVPAMTCFVLATVFVFLIGRRFYGRAEGAAAAAMFALFPPMGAFAFTAMPQLPFIAAGMGAFCVFGHLPPRGRPLLTPLLLVPPFLFRETGVLLFIPMAFVMLGERRGRRRWLTVLAAGLASAVVLYGILEWQRASGKAVRHLHIFGMFNYSDAFPAPPPPLTIERVWRSLVGNVLGNLDELQRHWTRHDAVAQSLVAILALALLAAFRGARRRPGSRRDLLALGAGALAFVTLALMTALLTWSLYRGLRSSLFTVPLVVVAAAPAIVDLGRRLGRRVPGRRLRPALAGVGALFVLLVGAAWAQRYLRPGFGTTAGKRAVAFMEGLRLPESGGILVAPHDLARDYTLRHYPLRLSHLPRNAKTVSRLAEVYRIDAFIVTTQTNAGHSRSYRRAILDAGLVPTLETVHPLYPGVTVTVYERPRP
jgi:hypothetical protein